MSKPVSRPPPPLPSRESRPALRNSDAPSDGSPAIPDEPAAVSSPRVQPSTPTLTSTVVTAQRSSPSIAFAQAPSPPIIPATVAQCRSVPSSPVPVPADPDSPSAPAMPPLPRRPCVPSTPPPPPALNPSWTPPDAPLPHPPGLNRSASGSKGSATLPKPQLQLPEAAAASAAPATQQSLSPPAANRCASGSRGAATLPRPQQPQAAAEAPAAAVQQVASPPASSAAGAKGSATPAKPQLLQIPEASPAQQSTSPRRPSLLRSAIKDSATPDSPNAPIASAISDAIMRAAVSSGRPVPGARSALTTSAAGALEDAVSCSSAAQVAQARAAVKSVAVLASEAAAIMAQRRLTKRMSRMREEVREENDSSLVLGDAVPTKETVVTGGIQSTVRKSLPDVKICTLGAQWTGKSQLLGRLLRGYFEEDNDPTVEDNFVTYWIVDDEELNLHLRDTAGDSSFDSMHEKWIQWADAFVICYNCRNVDTFDVVPKLISEIQKIKGPKARFIIVASHSDLDPAERKVTSKEGSSIAFRYHCNFYEISNKLSYPKDIQAPFEDLVRATRRKEALSEVDPIVGGHVVFNGKKRYAEVLKGRLEVSETEMKQKPTVYKLDTISFKPCPAKRNTLELLSVDTKLTIVLSTTVPKEIDRWTDAILSQIALSLTSELPMDEQPAKKAGEVTPEDLWKELLQLSADNCKCADCNAPDPDWCSVNLGILLCVQCAAGHRAKGVFVTKMRSLTLDLMDSISFAFTKAVGNGTSNAVYEAKLGTTRKPLPTDSRPVKEQYIGLKYVDKKFLDRSIPPDKVDEALCIGVANDDIRATLHALALGADVFWAPSTTGKTALHLAAEKGNLILAVAIVNHAMCLSREKELMQAVDNSGETPLQAAARAPDEDCSVYLSTI
eukprot:m51a1_g6779 putative arf-gap with sh3 ank repeat and ph domain-containing protein 2 (898) ;mRNA; f:130849-134354